MGDNLASDQPSALTEQLVQVEVATTQPQLPLMDPGHVQEIVNDLGFEADVACYR